jgi:hypothetical protein
MRKILRDNGLSIVLFAIFAVVLTGQALSGWRFENTTLAEHGAPTIGLGHYLVSGGFLSALFENWESEFLQMWAFVMLTAYLYQRGSPESKDPDGPSPQDRDPALDAKAPDAPWPVRAGGLVRVVYSHSLGLALLALFIGSFVLHWINSFRAEVEEAQLHDQAAPTLIEHLASASFWFESFQNWQSEFLSTALLIVLAIFLRERGSPESKPVSAPNTQTASH